MIDWNKQLEKVITNLYVTKLSLESLYNLAIGDHFVQNLPTNCLLSKDILRRLSGKPALHNLVHEIKSTSSEPCTYAQKRSMGTQPDMHRNVLRELDQICTEKIYGNLTRYAQKCSMGTWPDMHRKDLWELNQICTEMFYGNLTRYAQKRSMGT